LTKTIKRQAFNKDRKERLTVTTKPNGRKSTSLIDFSLPPRTPPRSSSAARDRVPAAGTVVEQDVVMVGGQLVALSGEAGSEQGTEHVGYEPHDSASDGSRDNAAVHSDQSRSSGEESDQGEQCRSGDASTELPVDARALSHDELCSHDSPESSPSNALSSPATFEHVLPHSAASSVAAGEGWDNLSPFADVELATAAAKDRGGGEGQISLLPLNGLLFYDIPMY
jgi:hypothetical protein